DICGHLGPEAQRDAGDGTGSGHALAPRAKWQGRYPVNPGCAIPDPRCCYSWRGTMPDKVGRYAIVRKLGEGGMGVVYEARDESLGRAVALKLIREDVADEQAAKRFRREAKAAASVNHPNVCQLFEIGEEAGALFIVMEMLEGEPLADRIAR